MQSFSKVLLICWLFIDLEKLKCSVVRRYNYDARLYEHFALNSRFIQYSRTQPDDWRNITSLVDSRNFTFASMICTLGPGAWIFYPEAEYGMGNSQIYYLVIGEHCVRSDDIGSVQPLGKMDELHENGILLFENPDFGSPQTLIIQDGGAGFAGSLIFTGGRSFEILGFGNTICVRPGLTVFRNGYCLIPNFKASFGIDGTVIVTENCTEMEEDDPRAAKKVVMQNCYMSGVHEIYSDQDLAINKLKEVCSGEGDNFLKAKFTILMDMWKMRLGDDLLSQQSENEKPENLVKLSILWAMLEIFKESCTNVNEIYVYLLGHLFSMHLKHLWKMDGYNGTSTTAKQWEDTKQFFEFCIDQSFNIPYYSGWCRSADEFNREVNGTEGFTEEDNSWFQIVNGEMFDPVIEQIWLIINFVLPSCSTVSGYTDNYWSDLVVVFHQNYLDPLQDIWADPGDWKRIYSAVFHGYDMRKVHKDIVSCLRGALEASPSYDPIGRPKSFRKLITYKYKTPDKGAVQN